MWILKLLYVRLKKKKALKAVKLEGQDNLCPWVLKELAHEIACPAARIFNKAADWQQSTAEKQTSWQNFRKGRKELPENIRVTSTVFQNLEGFSFKKKIHMSTKRWKMRQNAR